MRVLLVVFGGAGPGPKRGVRLARLDPVSGVVWGFPSLGSFSRLGLVMNQARASFVSLEWGETRGGATGDRHACAPTRPSGIVAPGIAYSLSGIA